jgi:hypothetical protein
MAHRRDTHGTGVTKRTVDVFTHPLSPDDALEYERAMEMQTFDGCLQRIERTCLEVLDSAQIRRPSINYSPRFEIEDRGLAEDSPEGFAVRILETLRHIRFCDAHGRVDDVKLGMFFVGQQWTMWRVKSGHEPTWERGLADKLSRARGGEATRKRSDAVRVNCWQRHFAVTGKKTESDRLAAEELGDAETTIRKARTAWEKAANASD